jgi:oxygen-dependent protoporphyrinogen oxidase
MRVAVVGGGIAGLSAAYEARKQGHEVVVHEASERAGGKLLTTPFAGRAVDEGADTCLARVPWAVELCRELAIDTELVSPATGAAYVFVDGALRSLPAGTVLGVPTDFAAAQTSGILSKPIEHHPSAAPLGAEEDIAVGELIRDQLGDEVLERLVDPLLGGINAGDADHLSIRAAAPQLAAAAERSGDLVAALRAQPAAAPGPIFYSPVGGMGVLVDALLATGVDVRLQSAVTDLESLDADAVVLATPAWVTASLVRGSSPSAAALLDNVRYASVTLVTMAFAADAIDRPLDGSGYLVPRTEGLLLTACSWATTKWAHLAADDGLVVVRASAGRIGDDRASELDDDAVTRQLVEDLATTMAVRAEPTDVRVSRWPRGFPQYEPGHLARIEQVERLLAATLPRVHITGAAMRGLGVPACIREGRASVRALSSL